MALAGQAAMVAQFAGVDAYGLIKMIADAAQTVRRNRATCLQLARRAKMIGDLMHQLHAAHLMQQPETRNPMEQLEETLRRALSLVRSCQRRGYLYRCFMGARHADELREVQGEITFYLQLFPLLSYVDTTLTWVRLLNKPAPAPQPTSCKEAQAPVTEIQVHPIQTAIDHKVAVSEAQSQSHSQALSHLHKQSFNLSFLKNRR
ncbi:hypothetical protein ZWY2020_018808 [Hordeum vulgare]|nr:hypothetical protein ZWY2020_018808 [Hordeum vulgare]